jgi:hypothetical protein
VPGTDAVAFNCVLLSAVPYVMAAGVAQVIVGVVLVGLGLPPYGPQAWLINGSVSTKKLGHWAINLNVLRKLTNPFLTLLLFRESGITLLRRFSGQFFSNVFGGRTLRYLDQPAAQPRIWSVGGLGESKPLLL